MASEEQLRTLTDMVREAIRYKSCGGDNKNPGLGQAIRFVYQLLLPWARSQTDGDFDVENIVAEASLKMLRRFSDFRGTGCPGRQRKLTFGGASDVRNIKYDMFSFR